jgi:hypothetical protein
MKLFAAILRRLAPHLSDDSRRSCLPVGHLFVLV